MTKLRNKWPSKAVANRWNSGPRGSVTPSNEKWVKYVDFLALFIIYALYFAYSWQLPTIVFLLGLIPLLITIILLIRIQLIDEGICPKHILAFFDLVGPELAPWLQYYSSHRPYIAIVSRKSTSVAETISNTSAEFGKVQWCSSCFLFRSSSLNMHHCSDCGHCMYSFDHHCALLGKCIGGYNLSTFLIFLFSAFITSLYIFSTSIAVISINILAYHENELSTNYWMYNPDYPGQVYLWSFGIIFFLLSSLLRSLNCRRLGPMPPSTCISFSYILLVLGITLILSAYVRVAPSSGRNLPALLICPVTFYCFLFFGGFTAAMTCTIVSGTSTKEQIKQARLAEQQQQQQSSHSKSLLNDTLSVTPSTSSTTSTLELRTADDESENIILWNKKQTNHSSIFSKFSALVRFLKSSHSVYVNLDGEIDQLEMEIFEWRKSYFHSNRLPLPPIPSTVISESIFLEIVGREANFADICANYVPQEVLEACKSLCDHLQTKTHIVPQGVRVDWTLSPPNEFI
jgi:DHHC palmitoyltransferase